MYRGSHPQEVDASIPLEVDANTSVLHTRYFQRSILSLSTLSHICRSGHLFGEADGQSGYCCAMVSDGIWNVQVQPGCIFKLLAGCLGSATVFLVTVDSYLAHGL